MQHLDEKRLRELQQDAGSEGFAAVLNAFAQQLRDYPEIPESSTLELERWAHKLRSSALTVGAPALSDRADAVERAARLGDARTARELANAIPNLVSETLKALAARTAS